MVVLAKVCYNVIIETEKDKNRDGNKRMVCI